MAKNYRDDFDYSEAIANTQDAAERQELLAERQNKIDAEGLAGKVASNDAVATWNGDYRPYSVSSRGGSSSARSEADRLYDAAEQARLKRFQAARERIQQQLDRNLSSIETDYAAGMKQTDINARQSVISNEEKLAALGLNMGARGAAATSGAAETSRIAVDNQYRSDLNALGQARLQARAAAQDAASEQTAALENEYYTAAESAALQQAQAQLAQFNADRHCAERRSIRSCCGVGDFREERAGARPLEDQRLCAGGRCCDSGRARGHADRRRQLPQCQPCAPALESRVLVLIRLAGAKKPLTNR